MNRPQIITIGLLPDIVPENVYLIKTPEEATPTLTVRAVDEKQPAKI